jgi:hypothetical protein
MRGETVVSREEAGPDRRAREPGSGGGRRAARRGRWWNDPRLRTHWEAPSTLCDQKESDLMTDGLKAPGLPLLSHPRRGTILTVVLAAAVCFACGGSAAASAPATSARAGFHAFFFKTPSGNIVCEAADWTLRSGAVICAVVSTGTRVLPPATWYLRVTGPVRIQRPNDGPDYHNKIVLYGQLLSLGFFRCRSMVTGLRCWSRISGHGFFLSRERQAIY